MGSYPADSTAFGWRDANFLVSLLGSRSDDVQQRWHEMIPLMEGMYLSFETDTGPDVVARAFPPGHLQRLRTLKALWDPSGLLRDNFFIASGPMKADPRTVPARGPRSRTGQLRCDLGGPPEYPRPDCGLSLGVRTSGQPLP